MKGAKPPALDRGDAEQGGDPVLHLPRRLVGEGDRQDLTGMGLAAVQQKGEPCGQRPRLAGAGAGQHQERTVERLDGLALGHVELGQVGRRLGSRFIVMGTDRHAHLYSATPQSR
jgi:hypothetical protein